MREYDDAVLECFLDKQLQLFHRLRKGLVVGPAVPRVGAENPQALDPALDSVEDVIEYFDEAGMDVDGAVDDEILEADEVFDIGDGRYLIVEA